MGQNLLSDNQASIETDTTGLFANPNTTITRDTVKFKCGVASLKSVTDDVGDSEGFGTLSITVAANTDVTVSGWVQGPSGTVVIIARERNGADAQVGDTLSDPITLSNTWQRISVTRSFGGTGVKARLVIQTNVSQGITFYADCLQIEQSSNVTPWRLPSRWGARNTGRDIVVLHAT